MHDEASWEELKPGFNSLYAWCSHYGLPTYVTPPPSHQGEADQLGSAPRDLVQMAETVVVPHHGTIRVPVIVDSGANNKTDGTTYGFFSGTPSGQFVVCNGVGNVVTKDQFNFVTLTNTTNKDLKLAKGRAVATFLRDDLEAYDTMLAADLDAESADAPVSTNRCAEG